MSKFHRGILSDVLKDSKVTKAFSLSCLQEGGIQKFLVRNPLTDLSIERILYCAELLITGIVSFDYC